MNMIDYTLTYYKQRESKQTKNKRVTQYTMCIGEKLFRKTFSEYKCFRFAFPSLNALLLLNLFFFQEKGKNLEVLRYSIYKYKNIMYNIV